MKAVVFDSYGDESVLRLGEVPRPSPDPGEVLIRVRCAGVNRADLMQRAGVYPPPPGASEILGLECSGEIDALGPDVGAFRAGERVMALLQGGGYAEYAVAEAGSVMRMPAALGFEEAAAFPEAFITAFLSLFILGGVRAGDWVLVHGGGSGVGTAAIQLLKEAGARAIVTAGSDEKCALCLRLGALAAINYKLGPFAAEVKAKTAGVGADVILDSIGALYLAQNVEALAPGARLVLIGLMGGARAELDLASVLRRHLTIIGSTLRGRSAAEKAEIIAALLARFGAALEAGRLRPPIHGVLPLGEAAQAHRLMQASAHFGKLVLRVE